MIVWSGTDLIKQARFANGSLGEGVTMSADEVHDDLMALNMLLSSWDVILYANTQETKALTIGKDDYTWGTGGDINTARPFDLLDMTFIRDDDSDFEVKKITESEYDSIGLKTNPGRPDRIFFSPQNVLAVVYFYPVPDAAYTVYLTSQKGISEITDVTADVLLPADLVSALKWNLAVELAPNYGVPVSQVMAMRAGETKKNITNRATKYGLTPAKMDNVTGRNRASKQGTILSY